jgi:uncharacterized repeat protein (TIGR01451 family)
LTGTKTVTATVTPTPTLTMTAGGAPVDLLITITAKGDNPAPGAKVDYTITIQNNSGSDTSDIRVWETLPNNLVFTQNFATVAPAITGQYILWDFTGQTLAAGQQMAVEFSVVISSITPGDMIETVAGADYHDPYYSGAFGRHPPIFSYMHFYPEGQVIVVPNPYNITSNKTLKFLNIVPGSLIAIYTLSGEMVNSLDSSGIRAEWNGKNRNNSAVSPGIYYYLITNQATGQIKRGKIFIVKN